MSAPSERPLPEMKQDNTAHLTTKDEVTRSTPSLPPLDAVSSVTATGPSALERLPLGIHDHISSFVPIRSRMTQLTHLSHSFPPLTRAAFRDDHLVITATLLSVLSTSPSLRDLLSEVPSALFVVREREVLRWKAESTPSSGVRPPLLPGVVQLVIRLTAEELSASVNEEAMVLLGDEMDDDEECVVSVSIGLCPHNNAIALIEVRG
jgi:hypothetical protein